MKEKGNNSSSREWIAVYQLLLVVSCKTRPTLKILIFSILRLYLIHFDW